MAKGELCVANFRGTDKGLYAKLHADIEGEGFILASEELLYD